MAVENEKEKKLKGNALNSFLVFFKWEVRWVTQEKKKGIWKS